VRKQLVGIMNRHQASLKRGKQKKKKLDRPGTPSEAPGDEEHDPATLPSRVLKCLLTGFHPNVARLSADGSYRTLLTNQPVSIHPSSVLFSAPGSTPSSDVQDPSDTKRPQAPVSGTKKFEAIMYNEFVYTGTKAYARGVSAVQMQWVAEVIRR